MEVAFLFTMVVGFLLIGVPIAFRWAFVRSSFCCCCPTRRSPVDRAIAVSGDGRALYAAGNPVLHAGVAFMSTGGVAQRIIRFSIACVGHLPGGLAIAGVFACMMFAALAGRRPATVVAIGSIVIAGMRQVGYTKEFAAGVICNAGTLGILIPPVIVMVVYASATDVSVGRMFLAGVIPGLLAGLMLMVTILWHCHRKEPAQGGIGWVGERSLPRPATPVGGCS